MAYYDRKGRPRLPPCRCHHSSTYGTMRMPDCPRHGRDRTASDGGRGGCLPGGCLLAVVLFLAIVAAEFFVAMSHAGRDVPVVAGSVVADRIESSMGVVGARCPDLPARRGSSVDCAATSGGRPVRVGVVVTSVDGSTVLFDSRLL